jgi:putative membrane protein insertion efficiency factor
MKLKGHYAFRIIAIALVLSLLLLADISRKPDKQVAVKMLVFSIEKYRTFISPHLKGAVTCKFNPGCSSYAVMALKKHGAFRGAMMTIIRLVKCSPLSSAHGKDFP